MKKKNKFTFINMQINKRKNKRKNKEMFNRRKYLMKKATIKLQILH